MPSLRAGLFSLSAIGTLGKELVYYMKEGIQCVRDYVIPVQPDSASQLLCREYFALAVESWQETDANTKSVWNQYATEHKKPLRFGYHCYLSQCIEYLQDSSGEKPEQPFLPGDKYEPPQYGSISGSISGDTNLLGTMNCKLSLQIVHPPEIIQTINLENDQTSYIFENVESGSYYVVGDKGDMNDVDPDQTSQIDVTPPNNYSGYDFTFTV